MKRFAKQLTFTLAMLGIASICHAATYNASLSGPNESPPNTTTGSGNATVTLDTTAHTLQVSAAFSGLSANTVMAHIHCCVAPPGTAGVATTVPAFVGFPLGVTSGNFNNTYNTLSAGTWNASYITANGGTPAGAEAALAAGLAAGNAYFNIHTTAFPGGEVRGFLVVSAPASVIPTLSGPAIAGAVALVALLGFVLMRRRAG